MEKKLNKRERYKAQLRPIDYYKDFETIDFDSLNDADRYYLQDFGIFTTDFLEGEYTVRIRIPGGRLTCEQFEAIADIVSEFDLTIILTARAGIQLHDVESDDLLEIHERINNLGVSTWQSFGDNVRNIVTDPYDGRGKYAKIEVQPLINQMQDYILKNPRYVGMLPRRVSIGISGNTADVVSFFANDIYFGLANKDGELGFNVYMGGKNTEVARAIDIFLKEDEVFDFFKAFIEAFYLHGSRYSRAKTRIFHMLEDIGVDGMRAHIKNEYKKDFVSAGELILEKEKFEEFHELKDGSFGFCYQTDFSRLKADEIKELSDYANKHNAEVRFGIDQNVYILGLKEKTTSLKSPAISQTILACAGNLCPYAVWSIKDETSYIPLELINKHQITVGFSGCAKGCGRHRHTDIGLIGLKTNNFGPVDGGARVFLGALHSDGQTVGRELFSMVPFVHLNDTLECIIKLFELSKYKVFEEWAEEVLQNYSERFLSLWILSNLETSQVIKLEKLDAPKTYEEEKELLKKEFKDLDFWEHVDENFFNAVSYLSKKLWTIAGEDAHYKPKLNRVNFR